MEKCQSRVAVESYEEFLCLKDQKEPEDVNLCGWVFQGVDLTSDSSENFFKYQVEGCVFLGCLFPDGVSKNDLVSRGAMVHQNPENLPFKPYRGFMYRQDELRKCDADIYNYYLSENHVHSKMWQAAHDFCINDALSDYLEGKSIVAIMGGHGLKRESESYEKIMRIAQILARNGFVVATGGGPGAMEAANLGAYLADKSPEDTEEALRLIREKTEGFDNEKVEYLDQEAPNRVIKRFGDPTYMPSLGIPTWKYGHEPSNVFATWQAKFFSNAIREDGLIQIANCGIIYSPGSAGTRQEIFQDACRNHYAEELASCPMGEEFWKTSGVYDLVVKTSEGRSYHDFLLCSDGIVRSALESTITNVVGPTKGQSFRTIKSAVLV